jgi:YggT family protein
MGGVLARNFIEALAMVLSSLLWLYWWIVLISVLISWVSPDPRNPVVRVLRSMTEPLFWQIRRAMPFVVIGAIDLSPIVVMLGIMFLQRFVVASLVDLAAAVTSV